MACRILLISRGSKFMTDALISNLKKYGFETIQSEPDAKSIETLKKDTDLVLLLAGDYVYNSAYALVYLTSITKDEERPVCLIGYDDELGEIRKYIPEKYIKKAD